MITVFNVDTVESTKPEDAYRWLKLNFTNFSNDLFVRKLEIMMMRMKLLNRNVNTLYFIGSCLSLGTFRIDFRIDNILTYIIEIK